MSNCIKHNAKFEAKRNQRIAANLCAYFMPRNWKEQYLAHGEIIVK